ncbi:MAG: pantoate--beta-alanine ligase [Candidatus Cloacimonetes bacterium]|nr:pantoate--beta-alanine ligase [Candidatus Cloacimonadota bacterium]
MLGLSARYSLERGITGFVPTMGSLHEGHLSLVRAAGELCDRVVVSIFVNPGQFAPGEDLDAYPRDFDRDLELLTELGVNYVFAPSPEQMYQWGYQTWIEVEGLSQLLCGKSRPTHFRGVCTVVAKLLNIVAPSLMFMGEKDFQQIVVLRRLIEDLNFRTRIIRCPIVREEDGLAMSSRNQRLDPEERARALCLRQALQMAQTAFENGMANPARLRNIMSEHVRNCGGRVDYFEFVDPASLQGVEHLEPGTRALGAVFVGKIRLIDNLEIQ